MKYKNQNKNLISFPLGGIGTGCIGLGGNGRIIDVEIKNRPNKGSEGGFTHFAIKAEDENGLVDARVLNTDLPPDYIGPLERAMYCGHGLGPDRSTMAGFPHFRNGDFDGEFPIATLDFFDEKFPGTINMTAFNPFIPTNADDSSIPGAFFEFEIENTTNKLLDYTLAFSGRNYYCQGEPVHGFIAEKGNSYIHMSNGGDRETLEFGDVTIGTDSKDISYQESWYRGNWFDSVSVFWEDFCRVGKLKNRPVNAEKTDMVYANDFISTLAAHVKIDAGEKKTIRFVMSWSNPYMNNHWQITQPDLTEEETAQIRAKKWKTHYATQYETSLESCKYAVENFERLYHDTDTFRKSLYSSTMPPEAVDAVGANLAIIKSPTCLRLTDGSFYAFEGSHPHLGSCEGTCTHVWSYAYGLAYLFPELERSARKIEYTYSMKEDGGLGMRVQLPIGMPASKHRCAVDGQYGTVLRVYREFMLSGDKEWLAGIWSAVKSTVEYAWSEKNVDCWDRNKDGIIEGRQHHTLDMELFSGNAWLSGMYLAGLKAAAKLAEVMGDGDAKAEYEAVYESGVQKLNDEYFNGEYYIQQIDLTDRSLLSRFDRGKSDYVGDPSVGYWNDEANEMKYQIGEGCSIDQLLGQWHSDLLGLGGVFDDDKLKFALKSIYKYNYKPTMYDHVNPCRLYALNDESGTVICAYPDHVQKPAISVPYAEETMHGFEYATASHMIINGMEKEGLDCVRGVRNRYDGIRRNPWNEMECGSNYARSLASYALLLAYSGFKCDMNKKELAFKPLHGGESSYFWAVDSGFGIVEQCKLGTKITLQYGEALLNQISLGSDYGTIKAVKANDKEISFTVQNGKVKFDETIKLSKDDNITFDI